MSSAENLESEAVEIVCVDFLRLPPGRVSGTAERFVRLIVDAAVARIIERQPPADSDDLIGDVPAVPRPTLGLKGRSK